MNFLLAHHDPADEESAALWAARLDGDKLTPAALREFETWLAGHPARRALVTEYTQFAVDLGHFVPVLAAENRITVPASNPHRARSHRPAWRRSLALGGLVAAAAALVIVFRTGSTPPPEPESYATAAAQRHSLTMADGTRIDLSARTRVSIEFGQKERRVHLGAGEAFFAVAKDKSKPFTVETPAGSVLVTGTRFAVAAVDAGNLKVTVAEGSVQVTPAADASPVTVTTGQQLSTEGQRVTVEALPPDTLDNELAWREGHVVFNATPVSEALATFARYHGRVITTDPSLANLRIGGRYNLDDLQGFLGAIQEIVPVQIEHKADGTILVGRRAHD